MLLIKRQQKLIFHHNFCKSHWSVESNFFFLICYPYQINWRQAILDGVLSPHRILNLKLIQNERFKMDLSLRQHKPAEFAPHDRRGGLATAAEWDMPPGHCLPLGTKHGPHGAQKPLPPGGSSFQSTSSTGRPLEQSTRVTICMLGEVTSLLKFT